MKRRMVIGFLMCCAIGGAADAEGGARARQASVVGPSATRPVRMSARASIETRCGHPPRAFSSANTACSNSMPPHSRLTFGGVEEVLVVAGGILDQVQRAGVRQVPGVELVQDTVQGPVGADLEAAEHHPLSHVVQAHIL